MTDKQLYILLGVGALGLWYLKNKAVEVAGDVAQAVNPVNYDNVFHSGANALGEALTGDEHFTVGGWWYDWWNGE